MIKVTFSHKTYSENKVKIKQIIKKYGMSWDDKKSGWISEATGDGVFIDKSVMEMILGDAFDENMPMTLFVKSDNQQFLTELEAKSKALGGSFERDVTAPATTGTTPSTFVKKVVRTGAPRNIHMKVGAREEDSTTTGDFKEKAHKDLKDINARWERRRRELLREYACLGLEKDAVEKFLVKDEIAFRKNNACWVTGEFPSAKSE